MAATIEHRGGEAAWRRKFLSLVLKRVLTIATRETARGLGVFDTGTPAPPLNFRNSESGN